MLTGQIVGQRFSVWVCVSDPPLEALPGVRRELIQTLYLPLLWVLAKVRSIDSREFPLFPKLSLNVLHFQSFSCALFFEGTTSTRTFLFPSTTTPSPPTKIYSISPSQGDLFVLPQPSLLLSISRSVDYRIINFIGQLISTYVWVHITSVFQGLGYLTQDDFFPLLYICLQISCKVNFTSWVTLHCVNVLLFLYPFFS